MGSEAWLVRDSAAEVLGDAVAADFWMEKDGGSGHSQSDSGSCLRS